MPNYLCIYYLLRSLPRYLTGRIIIKAGIKKEDVNTIDNFKDILDKTKEVIDAKASIARILDSNAPKSSTLTKLAETVRK